ncbi:MAG: orotidine 5'-phosphate decarboxylase / HUMPS family protein [Patescibacteria group bacterium]
MDFTDMSDMVQWAETLAPVEGNWGFKVNDDFLNKYTPLVAIEALKPFKKRIFADTKMFKGTRRMINIARELGEIGGVQYTNVFALVGRKMLKKVVEGTKDCGVEILALTVLTHMDEEYCQEMFGRSLSDSVKLFAEIAHKAGCAGAVLPGTCLAEVQDMSLVKVVPGIRPVWYESKKANPQDQTVTPAMAVKAGADELVTSSPIFDTENPIDSLKRILEEMDSAQ